MNLPAVEVVAVGEAVVVPNGKVVHESNPGSGIAFFTIWSTLFYEILTYIFLVDKKPIHMEFKAA